MLIWLGCEEVSQGGVVRMLCWNQGIRVESAMPRKSPGLRCRCLVLALALPLLTCCVILGRSLSLSGP